MIVGVLTTCHTQYTWDSSICIFLFNRTTLPSFCYIPYRCSLCAPFVILQTSSAFTAAMDRTWDQWWSDATRLATSFSRCNPMWFLSMGLRQGSGLCSSSSRKYPGTRIRTAIETITADMLQTFWNELDYRVDVRRITKGAHIEHL